MSLYISNSFFGINKVSENFLFLILIERINNLKHLLGGKKIKIKTFQPKPNLPLNPYIF